MSGRGSIGSLRSTLKRLVYQRENNSYTDNPTSWSGNENVVTTPADDWVFQGRKFRINKVLTVPDGGMKIVLDTTACTEVIFRPFKLIAAEGSHIVKVYETQTAYTGGTQVYGNNLNDINGNEENIVIKHGVTCAATPPPETDEYLVGLEAGVSIYPGGGSFSSGADPHVHDPDNYIIIEIGNDTGTGVVWYFGLDWYE